jgi:hypothetical protein
MITLMRTDGRRGSSGGRGLKDKGRRLIESTNIRAHSSHDMKVKILTISAPNSNSGEAKIKITGRQPLQTKLNRSSTKKKKTF